jgi:DNA-binding protein H-NS
MEGFTKDLLECATVRADALSEVNVHTKQLLSDVRTFMHHISQERQEQVAPLHAALAEEVRERHDEVQAMRHEFQEHMGKMHEHLQEMFSEDRRARHEDVADLRKAFHAARAEVVNDLREMARVWRGRSRKLDASPSPVAVQPQAGEPSPVQPVISTTWQATERGADDKGGDFP